MLTNREHVGKSFGRHAHEYDRHASVQKRVVERLANLATSQRTVGSVRNFLDVGCGTGNMLSKIAASFPHATGVGIDLAFEMAQEASGCSDTIVGDAEKLPILSGCMDLIVSASALQWMNDLSICLSEFSRVLSRDGRVCVALFGGATLWELHHCYRQVFIARYGAGDARIGRLHRFYDVEDISKALAGSGLNSIELFSEQYVEVRSGLIDLLGSIKGVGAGPAGEGGGGLGWRGILKEVEQRYRKEFGMVDGTIPATYETIYFLAETG